MHARARDKTKSTFTIAFDCKGVRISPTLFKRNQIATQKWVVLVEQEKETSI